MPFERGAGAEGDDGHAVRVAELQQLRRFLAALEEGDGVGHRVRLVVLAVAVLFAQRLA